MRRLAPVAMEAAIADWAGAPYTLTQKQAPATYSVTELAVMVFLLLLAGCASHHQGAGASGGASATGANASRGSGASNRTGIALDLVGYSSTAALGQLAIPITEADVDFYLRIMRSTLERLQHLSPRIRSTWPPISSGLWPASRQPAKPLQPSVQATSPPWWRTLLARRRAHRPLTPRSSCSLSRMTRRQRCIKCQAASGRRCVGG